MTCYFRKYFRGWSGGAKVLCILHHWGVQLILAYSWARPAILVVGKGGGGMFLFLLFLHFHSCSSFFPVPLFHLLYSLFYLFSPFLWETTQNDPQGLTCRLTPTQSIVNISSIFGIGSASKTVILLSVRKSMQNLFVLSFFLTIRTGEQ